MYPIMYSCSGGIQCILLCSCHSVVHCCFFCVICMPHVFYAFIHHCYYFSPMLATYDFFVVVVCLGACICGGAWACNYFYVHARCVCRCVCRTLSDDSPLGLRRILSQSTDSLNFRSRTMSMESLNDEGRTQEHT